MSLLKISKNQDKRKINKDLENEIPFFITVVTLLASAGFGPYTIFQKVTKFDLLPYLKEESNKILKKIDILGIDPLTVMSEEKFKGPSKSLGNFLGGYVSAIQGGGDVVSYLKNKMTSSFELYEHTQKEIAKKVTSLVETYMTMQIVVLAVYIIIIAVAGDIESGSLDPVYPVVFLGPILAVMFLVLAHKMNRTTEKEEWKNIIMFGMPGIMTAIVLHLVPIIPGYNVIIISAVFIGASIMPAIKYSNIHRFSLDAISGTAQIIRDITETRKAGLGPEKCIANATKRQDFETFNRVANAIASKMEWGLSLEEIYNFIKKEISNFKVLINFRILFEIISSGGGHVHTLETLAGVAERMDNIEKEKLEMLKPYVMIGFMMVGITGFSTLFVVDSLGSMSFDTVFDEAEQEKIKQISESRMEFIASAIIVQAWLSGLFLGKVITGSFSGGFRYSMYLVAISLAGIIAVQMGVLNISVLFE